MAKENMRPISVQEITGPTPAELDIEIVERKGLGHPDTICDLVMERISQALSQAYLKHYGRILHHNCDKGLLVAGKVERCYGGGRVVEPMRLVIGDRATLVNEFDVAEVAVATARQWFHENLPEVDPVRHLLYQVELKGGSDELTGIFKAESVVTLANDTSAAVGYAPLTETEKMLLEAEQFLNGSRFKHEYPESGRDVKIMGIRERGILNLTVAMPLLDKYINNEAAYFKRKEEMCQTLTLQLRSHRDKLEDITVKMNTLDRTGAGMSGMYLSVLGTSAEDADSGEVGRGNQVNGIIALNRPRGSEAAAGKNPISHVGKIYSLLTHVVAAQIYQSIPVVRQAVVWLCSRIGAPVSEPQVAAVQVALDGHTQLSTIESDVREIVAGELERLPDFCRALAEGKYSIC
ncbi:MAG: methionine adenosyltransferase [Alphaproteobacteria bacterium]